MYYIIPAEQLKNQTDFAQMKYSGSLIIGMIYGIQKYQKIV